MANPGKPRFDLQQVSEADRHNLSTTFMGAVQRFYEDPVNLERFEAWQAQRQSRRAVEKE